MLTTKTIGNSSPFAAWTVIRLTASMRVDRGVRFVADREPLEMVGDAGERRVAAVLNAADHAAQLLQVLARLHAGAGRAVS